MSRPSDKPNWINDDVTDIEIPTPAEQDAGWSSIFTTGLKPPRQWFNWFQNRVVLWRRWLSGQAGEYIVIDSTVGNEDERDYETLADYIADSPSAADKVLVKDIQVLTAQMVIPDNITLKILNGADFARSTNEAVSVVKLGAGLIIEGVLNLVLVHSGVTAVAVEVNGNNNLGNISVENGSTGTVTDTIVLNSGVEGNKINAIVANTGGGTISNIVQDDSLKSTNDLMVRDIENNKIISLHNHLSGKNLLDNSCFSIFQEGLTIDSTTTPANNDDTYIADVWNLLSDGNDIVDVSRDKTDIPIGSRSSIKFDVETANKKFGIAQFVEGVNSRDIIGGKASFSFKAKVSSGATIDNLRASIISWDSTEDSLTTDIVSAWNGVGVDPALVANWTYENVPVDLALTDSYQTFKIENIDVDTSGAKNVAVFIWIDDVDATIGNIVHITNAKLEKGRKSTPHELIHIRKVISDVQRLFEKSFDIDTGPANGGDAVSFSTLVGLFATFQDNVGVGGSDIFKVRKRIVPSLTRYGNDSGNWRHSGTTFSASLTTSVVSERGFDISQQATASSVAVQGHWTADARL
jgi:hypothetical protein